MTFVFPILLGGLVLAGIPILLHLILRQKPKTLPFPAFRFLIQKHRSNLRKLQLRHLLLLILRITLIAALCLALARPKLFHDSFNLSRERPVAAILIFDTSPTMDYKTSDKVSRLDEAKKRGKELLDELPDGSRVLILDTADAPLSDRGDWQTSFSEIRKRIDQLKIKPASGSVLRAVEQALRQFQVAARGDDESLRWMPRLLCAISDRTVASWPGGKQDVLHDAADQLPATLEGVQQLRSSAAPLVELLQGLRQILPPEAGKDYPDQALQESIEALRDRAASLQRESMTDDSLQSMVAKSRRQARDLRNALLQAGEQKTPQIEEYRQKTLTALHGLLRHLAGLQSVYLDVGVEQPVDVALLQLDLPRQSDGRPQELFTAGEKFILRAVVQALGKDVSTAVECRVGKHAVATHQVELKSGERQTVAFEIDLLKLNLGVGAHTLEVHLTSKDGLESNNQLFAAFHIRQPKRVLVLADAKAKAERFAFALQLVGYASEIKTVAELNDINWSNYEAAYLFGLANPSPDVWRAAEDYVKKGGGLGIVPGGDEMQPASYRHPAALKLMPGPWQQSVKKDLKKEPPDVPAEWNLRVDRIFQHPLLKPFRAWRDDETIDFIKFPRHAFGYWLLEPDPKKSVVLVTYADKGDPPALIERLTEGQGKVIVFTTPLDDRDRDVRWNDYNENLTSFYLALAKLPTQYLTGEDKGVRLNFQCGVEEPIVELPASVRQAAYTLRGPDLFETLAADPQAAELRVKQATLPGNYSVENPNAAAPADPVLARFSVNLPPEENDLTRVPAAEVESLFGAGSIVTAERGAELRDLFRGQWDEPLELFPYLMILLLFVLALENLLANKFYRKEE